MGTDSFHHIKNHTSINQPIEVEWRIYELANLFPDRLRVNVWPNAGIRLILIFETVQIKQNTNFHKR